LRRSPPSTYVSSFPAQFEINLVPVALEILEIINLEAEETRLETEKVADEERPVRFEEVRCA
jgi:hypothetical protein